MTEFSDGLGGIGINTAFLTLNGNNPDSETTMTTFTRTTTASTAATRREAETLLRDAAFVMSLTQRVKAEMVGDRTTMRAGRQPVRGTAGGLRLAAV